MGTDKNGNGTIEAAEIDVPVNIVVKTYEECSVNLDVNDGDKGCSALGVIGQPSLSGTDLNFDGANEVVLVVEEVKSETIVKEGLDKTLPALSKSSQMWAYLKVQKTYDGYGNQVYFEDFGDERVSGDETFKFGKFISPGPSTGGRWIVGRNYESYFAGEPLANIVAGQLPVLKGSLPRLYRHSRTYFDGLELGKLTKGFMTKGEVLQDKKVSDSGVIEPDERWITTGESAYDHHGNAVVVTNNLGRKRGYKYDADHIRATESFLE